LFFAWLAGARFDIAFEQLKIGNLLPPIPGSAKATEAKHDFERKEL
jgi:hypothetical protein